MQASLSLRSTRFTPELAPPSPRAEPSTPRTPRSPFHVSCSSSAPRISRRRWGSTPPHAVLADAPPPASSPRSPPPASAGSSPDEQQPPSPQGAKPYDCVDFATQSLAVNLTLEEYRQALAASAAQQQQPSASAAPQPQQDGSGSSSPAASAQLTHLTHMSLTSAELESMGLCTHCRYPCYLSGLPTCEASRYLQMWDGDAALKPRGFDAQASLKLKGVADIAAISSGGRANGRWKPDNQDAFLVQPTPSSSHAAAAAAAGATSTAVGNRGSSSSAAVASDESAAGRSSSSKEQPGPAAGAAIGVFDGHGRLGASAATIVRQAMAEQLSAVKPQETAAEAAGGEQGAAGLLDACFAAAEAALQRSGRDFSKSGCTAVLALLERDSVSVAWAGDSRAVLGVVCEPPGGSPRLPRSPGASNASLGSSDGAAPPPPTPSAAAAAAASVPSSPSSSAFGGALASLLSSASSSGSYDGTAVAMPVCAAVPLTEDHKPDRPAEYERITAAGGRVTRLATDKAGNPVGPHRVFVPNCWSPGLALSRAFGDTLASTVGVTSQPDVMVLPLPPPPTPALAAAGVLCSAAAAATSATSPAAAAASPAAPGASSAAVQGAGVSNALCPSFCASSEGSGGSEAAGAGSAAGSVGAERHVLIVASDGLWEWISNSAAVGIAAAASTAEDAAHALVEAAQRQWAVRYRGRNCDDITVVVAFLDR